MQNSDSELKASFYPVTHRGRVFCSDGDVSRYTGDPVGTIGGRRRRYNNIEEVINPPFVPKEENFYPQVVDGVTFNSDEEVSNHYSIPIYLIRNGRCRENVTLADIIANPYPKEYKPKFPREVFGVFYDSINDFCSRNNINKENLTKAYYSREDFTLESYLSKRADHEKYSKLSEKATRNKDLKGTVFWVCKTLLVPSLSEGCYKMGISVYNVNKRKELGFECAFIKAFVDSRVKDWDGYVTPDLSIEEFCWEDEPYSYYRCNLKGNIDYLSEYEITLHRLEYIEINKEKQDRYDGIYFSIASACKFYGISKDSLYLYRNSMSIGESILAVSRNIKVDVSSDGFVIKGQSNREVKRLKILSSDIRRVRSGEMSLKDAKEKKLLVTSKGHNRRIVIQEPIFDKKEIVRNEERVFYTQKQVEKYYKMNEHSIKHLSTKPEGATYEDCVRLYLIERQNRKVFVFGLEFSSKEAMCKSLGLNIGILKNRRSLKGISDKDLENLLLHDYFRVNLSNALSVSSFTNRVIKPDRFKIASYSFTDNEGIQYFRCIYRDDSDDSLKAKCMAGNLIMLWLVEDYKKQCKKGGINL